MKKITMGKRMERAMRQDLKNLFITMVSFIILKKNKFLFILEFIKMLNI